MGRAYVDIGELGWSLYLSAHVRWFRENTNTSIAVITYPERQCLYRGLAHKILDVPRQFYKKFDMKNQDCWGIRKVRFAKMRSFFLQYIPGGYHIPEDFCMSCRRASFYSARVVFKPFKYSKRISGKKEILVFPRCRISDEFVNRNLTQQFYGNLITALCREFPSLIVRAMGTKNGGYDISVAEPNYVNWVGKDDNLQCLIDRCQVAVVAVGSQSAPPKITLLQGVPTFMIGHERKRHVRLENWMKTKVAFYTVSAKQYDKVSRVDCTPKIIEFVRGCI